MTKKVRRNGGIRGKNNVATATAKQGWGKVTEGKGQVGHCLPQVAQTLALALCGDEMYTCPFPVGKWAVSK